MLNICRNLSFGFTFKELEAAEAVAGISIIYSTNMYKIMFEKAIIFFGLPLLIGVIQTKHI
jgi:hypothetical protein